MEEFRKRLKSLMLDGEKKYQFAQRVGVHRNTIINYFLVDRPPEDGSLLKICRATGVEFDWLKEGKEPKYAAKSGWVPFGESQADPQVAESLGFKTTRRLAPADVVQLIATNLAELPITREQAGLLAYLVKRAASDPRTLEDLLALAAVVETRDKMKKP